MESTEEIYIRNTADIIELSEIAVQCIGED